MTKSDAVISIIKSWDDKEIIRQWNDYCACPYGNGHTIHETYSDEGQDIIDKYPHCNYIDIDHEYFYIDEGRVYFFSDVLSDISPIDVDTLVDYLIDYWVIDDDKMQDIFITEYFPSESAKARKIIEKLIESDDIAFLLDEWDEVLAKVKKAME